LGTQVQQEAGTPRPGLAGGATYAPVAKPSREPDSGEERALKLLNESPRTSVEIRDLTGLSREHAARIMKGLYDKGFVVRDDAHKPYHYQLTDEGRKQVPPG
jgi:predicted ArsR family transcriptional regulator